ncbi:MAG TPA: RecQ family ATP-dependent DNA helicase [Pyrinomonadaceae bacterium]|jgi:ATP-dependent DNA helicase, RecQ family|nr:RecQ family ATP-dependent DNA helicase [Pyrinomonadaceae bacterium]
MIFNSSRALELLRISTGDPNALFREKQEEAIRFVVEGRGRLLVVQKTGWGKSLVYFIATKMLREKRPKSARTAQLAPENGPAILLSPLLALMRNQIQAAERMGVRALTINSENEDEWDQIERTVRNDEVDILLISPERLANERFRARVLAHVANNVSLLVIDEAHCISDWGHDFRPHYRLLERIAKTLPQNVRLLATTATANDRVIDDLASVLGPNLQIQRGDLNRPSLKLQTIRLPDQTERLAWLAEHVQQLKGSGIIYTLTIRDAIQVADWLKSRGLSVEAYTSDTGEHRPELEQALLENRVKALVATTALGMGYDKPDLAFVIHYQTPGSVVHYYQQVGRAGRAIDAVYGVLLSGEEEKDINDYFIESAFPTRQEVGTVVNAIEENPEGLSVNDIMGRINLTKGRIQKTLDLLSLESPAPVIKLGTRWQLTAAKLSEAFWQRANRLTELRRAEQKQMQEYVRLRSGHMEFLIQALDGNIENITQPNLPELSATPNPSVVRDAIQFLRRSSLTIEPRLTWPAGGMPIYAVKGKIASSHLASSGKVLCVWRDAGWGELVRKGKYSVGRFDEDLVEACERLIREWNPPVEWITCIPSLRHPNLVPDFTQRLAARLRLPFEGVLVKTDDRPEQKTMANSIQQARNIDGALAITKKPMSNSSVLLVDDMVDSRWTITVASWLLRSNGSGEVFPIALALT